MVLKTEPGIEPFFLISGSISVFYRFLAGFPVVDRLLTGFGAFNRTGLALGSQLNRMDRPVRSLKQCVCFTHCVHLQIAQNNWNLDFKGPFGYSWKLKIETEKYCSKIIFKCVNSTVGSIFNEKIAEKWNLWVHKQCTVCTDWLKKKSKKSQTLQLPFMYSA